MSLASPNQSPTLPPEISTSHLCLAAESTFSVGRSTRLSLIHIWTLPTKRIV